MSECATLAKNFYVFRSGTKDPQHPQRIGERLYHDSVAEWNLGLRVVDERCLAGATFSTSLVELGDFVSVSRRTL